MVWSEPFSHSCAGAVSADSGRAVSSSAYLEQDEEVFWRLDETIVAHDVLVCSDTSAQRTDSAPLTHGASF